MSSSGLHEKTRPDVTSPTVRSPANRFRVASAINISRSVTTPVMPLSLFVIGRIPQFSRHMMSAAIPRFVSRLQQTGGATITSLTFMISLLIIYVNQAPQPSPAERHLFMTTRSAFRGTTNFAASQFGDADFILHIRNARSRPSSMFSLAALRPGPHFSAKDNVPLVRFHGNLLRVQLGSSFECLFNLVSDIARTNERLDSDRVDNSLYAEKVAYGVLGLFFLIEEFNFAVQRDPPVVHQHLDYIPWHQLIPFE